MEKTVDTCDQEGNKLNLVVKKPSNKVLQEATVAYNAKIADLLRSDNGLMLRAELSKHLESRGVWSEESSKRFTDIAVELRNLEVKLRQGGIKVSEGRKYAVTMFELREEQVKIYQERKQYDSLTIESLAEEHKLSFILSRCTFREDGKTLYFTTLDECINKNAEVASIQAASILFNMIYQTGEDVMDKMFEIQWLQKYELMDDKKRLINKEGQLVSKENELVNDVGLLINEDGERIDVLGHKINEKGDLLIKEEQPFVDDLTGQPVKLKTKTKKRRKAKKDVK